MNSKKKTILIVDDTPENLQVLGPILEEQGYKVLVATSGARALETVALSPPDLILLDILMPGMDGYEVCRRLKSDPEQRRIPVIFLSALDLPEQKVQAFRTGAVDYITKPFQSDEVVARVHTHLQLTRIEELQREIAERERVEEARREQAEELEAIYEESPVIMMIVNESMIIQKINSSVRAFTSQELPELPGKAVGEVINCLHAAQGCGWSPVCQGCELNRAVLQTFASGESQQEIQGQLHLLREGRQEEGFFVISTKRLNFRKKPAVLLCLLDISEQHRLLEQITKQQKMESLGTLAGGIAHDFNNILSAMMGYAELAMMRKADEYEGTQDDLAQVRQAGYRATALVRQILTFSRQQPQEKHPLQISVIIKEALKLLRASIPTTIEIRQEIVSQAMVLADPSQIHQVIMNLCTNAYHAMAEEGGVLRVTLKDLLVEQTPAAPGIELPPGRYVTLAVSDTGCGMDSATLARIYDPYFTTKEVGKGTGLGLAVVDGIVKTHHGRIGVTSALGQGTTFRIHLPAITEAAESEAVESREALPLAQAQERVMVVDDEDMIRLVISQFLVQAGYQVEAFADGQEAWQAFAQHPESWDLLVSDWTMPRMTGDQLAAKVAALRPGLPVIFCTGYQALLDKELGAKTAGYPTLQKPVSRATLLTQVATSLGKNRAQGS